MNFLAGFAIGLAIGAVAGGSFVIGAAWLAFCLFRAWQKG